jgi:hypothetical protein
MKKLEAFCVALACPALGACTFVDRLDDLTSGTTAGRFAYIQATSTSPQDTLETVNMSFPAPQHAGDTNVVVIGWNSPQAMVASVSDSSDTRYVPAIVDVHATMSSQIIYYGTLDVSGDNIVTVAFDSPAAIPDIRAVEYATGGSQPSVVHTASAMGMMPIANAGVVTASGANELILVAGTTLGQFMGAASGFTLRSLTFPDNDIVEDAIAEHAGPVVAEAPLNFGDEWVLQAVVFQ